MARADRRISLRTLDDFKAAIKSKSESKTHQILAANPILFEPLMDRVGHHGVWYVANLKYDLN